MRTLRVRLAYDGTSFRGWASQGNPDIRTIEGVLVELLTRVLHEPVRLSVAGRTDAGVHARGQVMSFVTERGIRVGKLQGAINGHLGPEVVALDVTEVPASFDARFSASAREYRYVIDSAPVADPFTARFLWQRPGDLDVAAMRGRRITWWVSTTSRRSAGIPVLRSRRCVTSSG